VAFFDDDDGVDPDDEVPDDFCPARSGFVALELPSISSTFYVQIFCTNIVSAAFSTYM